jgi:AraC-like DNA-binding protein
MDININIDMGMGMDSLTLLVLGELSKRYTHRVYSSVFLKKIYIILIDAIKGGRDNPFCIDRVCREMGVSERSFYRRLKEIGMPYSKIKDEVERDVSVSLLVLGDYKIKEISEILGFKSPSVFIGKFKCWYGCSPKRWLSDNAV